MPESTTNIAIVGGKRDQSVLERPAVQHHRLTLAAEDRRRLVHHPHRHANGPLLGALAEQGQLHRGRMSSSAAAHSA